MAQTVDYNDNGGTGLWGGSDLSNGIYCGFGEHVVEQLSLHQLGMIPATDLNNPMRSSFQFSAEWEISAHCDDLKVAVAGVLAMSATFSDPKHELYRRAKNVDVLTGAVIDDFGSTFIDPETRGVVGTVFKDANNKEWVTTASGTKEVSDNRASMITPRTRDPITNELSPSIYLGVVTGTPRMDTLSFEVTPCAWGFDWLTKGGEQVKEFRDGSGDGSEIRFWGLFGPRSYARPDQGDELKATLMCSVARGVWHVKWITRRIY